MPLLAMTRDDALSVLVNARAELVRRGVRRAALFGSTVRGEARQGSDVDVLLEFEPGAEIGVYEYVSLERFIREQFPVPVDVVNRATLKAHVRPAAERDALYAF